MIQSIFHPFKSVSLSGEEWVPEIDSLSIATFENLSFQKQVDHWTSKKFGFREVMVRFYNQVLYWTLENAPISLKLEMTASCLKRIIVIRPAVRI